MFSYMFTLIFGGINCQIEHHIAPGIYPIYYPLVADEIKLFCKKYKIVKKEIIIITKDMCTIKYRNPSINPEANKYEYDLIKDELKEEK